MPIRLSDLRANKRTVAVEYDGETLNVEYRPQAVNPEYQDWLKNLGQREAKTSEAELWEKILAVVSGWDLLDDDGQPLPVSREFIAMLPTDLLMAITWAIQEDAGPNRRSAGSSGAGSRRKG